MSKVRIHASDGHVYEIDAPDGMSDEDIQKQFETQMGGDAQPVDRRVTEPRYVPKKGEPGYDDFLKNGWKERPDGLLDAPAGNGTVAIQPGTVYNGPIRYSGADDQRPTSQLQGFVEGVEKPLNNAAQWAENGLNMLGGAGDAINKFGADYLGTAPSVQAGVDYQQQQRDQSGYQSGGVGKFAGEVVGTALASRLPGGVLSKGAQAGALLSDDPNDVAGVARDAVTGAITGKIGDVAIRGAARFAAPMVSPALRTLIDAGVKVTPGQVGRSMGGRIGGAIARTEDRATSAPFLGDTVVNARNDTLDGFARATINRALNPIGESLPDGVPVGRGAVKYAGDKLSARYNAVAPNIRVDGADPQFVADLSSIAAETNTMLPERAKQFTSILGGLERFWRNNGTQLSGQAFKEVDERLGQNIRRYATAQDADQQQLGTMLESIRDAMWDAASRQNPDVATELKGLNQGWKALTQVERASGNSKAAVSPAGYSQAVKMSSDTVRRRGYSRGDALNQDLSDAASEILPSEIGDSGSGGRLSQQSILQSLIGMAQIPAYGAAQKVTPLLLRQNGVSPATAKLLRYLATASPYAAPAAVGGASNILPSQ